MMTFSNDTFLSSNLRLQEGEILIVLSKKLRALLLPKFKIIRCGLTEVNGPLLLRYWTDHSLSDVRQELQRPGRWLSRCFRHDLYMLELEALVVGKHDALLLFNDFVAIIAVIAALAYSFVLKVFRSDDQT